MCNIISWIRTYNSKCLRRQQSLPLQHGPKQMYWRRYWWHEPDLTHRNLWRVVLSNWFPLEFKLVWKPNICVYNETHPTVTDERMHSVSWPQHSENKMLTVKNALHIDCHHIVPSFDFGEVVVRCTPGNPWVIHKNVQPWFTLLDFCDESITSSFILQGSYGYQSSVTRNPSGTWTSQLNLR